MSNTRKYDRGLTHIRRNVLHWLDVTDRVRFRVCVQMFKCLHGMAPDYLSTMCHPASRLPGRQNLRSANRGSSTFHVLHCRRAVFEPSRMLVHLCGTLCCPFISKTAIWLLQLSCAILSLIFFSVLISYWARLGCDHINALYKFTITTTITIKPTLQNINTSCCFRFHFSLHVVSGSSLLEIWDLNHFIELHVTQHSNNEFHLSTILLLNAVTSIHPSIHPSIHVYFSETSNKTYKTYDLSVIWFYTWFTTHMKDNCTYCTAVLHQHRIVIYQWQNL